MHETIAAELDATQTKMLAIISPCPKGIDEELPAYFRRRAREARKLAQNEGLWSECWKERFSNWTQHILRHPESHAGALIQFKDSQWLRNQRAIHANTFSLRRHAWTTTAGRTDTRTRPAKVQPRWQESYESLRESHPRAPFAVSQAVRSWLARLNI